MMHRDLLLKQARAHSRLAFTYADDGAFATAAKMLRETAEMFDAENKRIFKLMNPEREFPAVKGAKSRG